MRNKGSSTTPTLASNKPASEGMPLSTILQPHRDISQSYWDIQCQRRLSEIYIAKSLSLVKNDALNLFPLYLNCHPKRGEGPLLLGDLDSPVQDYIRMLRLSGGVVNARLVVAAARGLIIARNRSLIADYGGHLNPGQSHY